MLATGPVLADASGPDFVGAGVLRQAVVPGSAARSTQLVPVLSYDRSWLFVSTVHGLAEAGERTAPGPLRLGLQIASEDPLDYDGAPEPGLQSWPSRSRGLSLGAQAVVTTTLGPAPLRASLRARGRVGAAEGLVVDLRAALGVWKSERLAAQVHWQSTWGDRRANAQDFGAAAPTGGHRETRTGLTLVGAPDASWRALASIERRALPGAIARTTPQGSSTSLLLALVRAL